MDLIIRADGGPAIGFGHLIRTATIARAVIDHGGRVTCATATPETASRVFPENVEILSLSSRADPYALIPCVHDVEPDIVLADAYPVDTEYQQVVRQHTSLAVFALDAESKICADILINGNIYAENLEYDFIGSSPVQLLGPDYLPLRKQIRMLASQSPPQREKPKYALITMGGSDVGELTPMAVQAFDGLEISVDAIVGPGFSEKLENEVRTTATDVSANVSVTRDPEDLPKKMFQADFAVTTAGSTVYELLALATPFICHPVVDNQELVANSLRKRDTAIVLGNNMGRDTLKCTVKEYLTNDSHRKKHQKTAQDIVDGRGVERIYSKFLEFV